MKKMMTLIVAAMMSLLAVAKVIVPVPTVANKPYTGEPQTADILESELYTIDGNEERTDVGDYEIFLLLNDSTGYAWEGTDDDFVILPFSITQATNEWTTAPAIADWTYGETASVPTGAAKFGVPRVRYSGTANDGTVFTDVASVSMAGAYTADFTVAGTDNYSGLATNVPFHIKMALIEGEGGGEGGVSLSAHGYEGVYDGNGHSITVTATGADFTVEYALSNEGPWTGVNPVFTNACDVQVWYRVSSDLYTTVINSKKVTITRSVVEVPEIPSKTYTGELLKADVPASSQYMVIGNNGGIAAATYSFMLRLTDAVNTRWATTDDEFVTVDFVISKATIDVSGVFWDYADPFDYDGAAHSVLITGLPEGVTVKSYSNNTASAAGEYHATATVESGVNFAETSVPVCDWVINAKSIAGATVALGDRLVHTGLPLTQSVAGVTTADGFLLTASDYTVSDNTATDVGLYTLTVTGRGNFTGTATAQYTVYSTAGSELKDQVGDIGDVVPDENGGWKVVITNDMSGTTVEIGDNLGAVTIDLAGKNIVGKPGATGDAVSVAGGNGEPAIRIVASGESGDATVLTIVDSEPDDTDDVIGGRGGDGTPGGNGGAAIQVVGGTKTGVKVNIGSSVGVRGGDGGKDLSGNSRGGNGGGGVEGNVGTNDGTIAGGDGGSSENGRGGDGGDGVTGSVEVNNGEISGGEGGSSEHGRGGSGGRGVGGTVGGGTGTVTDGENGSEPTIIIVDGGKSGSLNEASIEVPYDGKGHGIKITVTEPAEGAIVTYSRSEKGPFTSVNPLFTNVVDHAAVWYTVSAEGYPAVTNWATVTIYPSAQKRFRVTYDYNGGAGGPEFGDFDIATYYGTSLPQPVRSGYLFCGWYEQADFSGKPVGRNTEVIASDITLHAKWERRRLWYTDTPFHLETAAYWDGFILAADDSTAGTIQVKVGKPNRNTGVCKVTATVQMAGEKKKISMKGTTFDGHAELVAKDGRKLVVSLTKDGMSGTFDGMAVDGSKNVFKLRDADSKLKAAQVLARWQGVYVAVVDDGSGFGGLSISVKKKGAVKVTGTLADGTKVSGKSQLLIGERECAIAFSWTKKTARMTFLIWLCEDGSVEISNFNDPVTVGIIENQVSGAYLASGARFRMDAPAAKAKLGAETLADFLPDGEPVVQNGTKWVVAKAGRVKARDGVVEASGENLGALKLTFKIKDSTFKGSFKVYQLVNGKLKKQTATVQGVVMGGVGYGTAIIKKLAVSFPVTIE